MQTNALPHYDDSINTTGCCAKFNPDDWGDQRLHFEDKPFVRATTRSALHIPINMGKVFSRVQKHIEDAGGFDNDNMIVLTRDISPWQAEHLFAVSAPVKDEENVKVSGDFITKVFEGPYRQAKHWDAVMKDLAKSRGGQSDDVYFFYTTCPKCAEVYGENYVVGVARL